MADLEIRAGLVIPERELRYSYSRASGPGGQNVNKLETRVQLWFSLMQSEVFSDAEKARIARAAGRRMTAEGELLMACDQHRHRERNRDELLQRLRRLILQALQKQKKRIKTKPTKGSQRRRVEGKRRRAQHKANRQRPIRDD